MNAYFMNITKEERENILDKHKSLYDGYAVRNNNTPSEQPLYTQDFANDKGGITVDNKGNVGQYNNKIYMKESVSVCEQCGKTMNEGECMECGYKMEDIYDVSKGFPKTKEGKPKTQSFDYVESECDECWDGEKLDMIGDGPYDLEHGTTGELEDEEDDDFILTIFGIEDLDDEMIEPLKEEVEKTREWFNKFKKYN